MIRAVALALLLLAPAAWAKGKKKSKAAATVEVAHPFADVPVAKLQVTDTRSGQAVVESKEGEVVLVRAGDLLGAEGLKIDKVTRGCVTLSGQGAPFTLCADVPEVPQT